MLQLQAAIWTFRKLFCEWGPCLSVSPKAGPAPPAIAVVQKETPPSCGCCRLHEVSPPQHLHKQWRLVASLNLHCSHPNGVTSALLTIKHCTLLGLNGVWPAKEAFFLPFRDNLGEFIGFLKLSDLSVRETNGTSMTLGICHKYHLRRKYGSGSGKLSCTWLTGSTCRSRQQLESNPCSSAAAGLSVTTKHGKAKSIPNSVN